MTKTANRLQGLLPVAPAHRFNPMNTAAPLPTILIDTREQLPYSFSHPDIEIKYTGLKTGDYSIEGFESNGVAIERKSLSDLVGSLTQGRARFHRECRRLMEFDSACVVVEADWSDIVNHHYTSQAHPNSIIGSIIAIEIDWGIPFYFLSNRENAQKFTERFLFRFFKKMQGEGRI